VDEKPHSKPFHGNLTTFHTSNKKTARVPDRAVKI